LLCNAADAPGTFRFIDTAAQAGLRAEMVCGGAEKQWITDANGSGVALLDYDRDDRLDVLIVNGSTIPRLLQILEGAAARTPQAGTLYLFRNLGNGRFEDVTAQAGLSNPYWGTGANAADFDNDGFADILVTNSASTCCFATIATARFRRSENPPV
jgi:hypothetical protein